MNAGDAIGYHQAFILFVVHHVKAFIGEQVAAGLLEPEDCRLILPVLNPNEDADYRGTHSGDYKNNKYSAHVECGMFPPSSRVKKQETLTLDNFVAYVEIEGYLDDYKSIEPMLLDDPTVLIKDVWVSSSSDSASDMRESLVLNLIHSEFGGFSEFSDSFAPLAHSGPVFISHGDALVEDTITSAFAGLTSNGPVRLHRRTVRQWVGNPISAATDQNQVVVAIADAIEALNAAYGKCKIVHGNISDQAILLKETAGGIKGVLADFDYASPSGDSVSESPELKAFQSIHSLEKPGAVRTRLDDWESILYLVCWLGTIGISREQRAEYATKYAEEYKHAALAATFG
ncbi:hypothetical protein H4S02_004355 [Coemansia sp. RSA 2611]|nr:hypothetical protein H4S02_004355 [Coemansia sp. RSA 2611]